MATILNTRMFIEGMEVDLLDNFDGSMTYCIDDITNISTINSDFTKTITIPGSANNNKLFNFLFEIKATTHSSPSGTTNIGYNYSFVKKAKCVILQDNMVVMNGYARLMDAVTTNGNTTYSIQVSSELSNLVSVLGDKCLHDLYPSGSTSPYDHVMNLTNIVGSWTSGDTNPATSYLYPIIFYGDTDFIDGSCYYTNSLRPCLFAKQYFDEVMSYANFTYDSNFLNSDFFKRIIIPYKDGQQLQLPVQAVAIVTASGTTSSQDVIIRDWDTDPITLFNVGTGLFSGGKFTPAVAGNYTFAASFQFDQILNQTGGGFQDQIFNKDEYIYQRIQVKRVSDDSLVTESHTSFFWPKNSYDFSSDQSPYTTPKFTASFNGTQFLDVGQYAQITYCMTSTVDESEYFRNASDDDIPGTGSVTFYASGATLSINTSSALEGNNIEFFQFVPKDVKMISYVASILQYFNLFAIQDTSRPRHLTIKTRDEYYFNPSTIDWTSKIDKCKEQVITPVPQLNSSNMVFSYAACDDYFNQLYTSSVGTIYGQKNISTGFEFSTDQYNVLDGNIFGSSPLVQYAEAFYPCEKGCEILSGSTNVFSTIGYNALLASGSVTLPETGFDKARVGLKIYYGGQFYTITQVFNNQSFQINDHVAANPAGTFSYYTKQDKVIVPIFESSDNLKTIKPTKTNPRILYYGGLKPCLPYFIQYTPTLSGITYAYPETSYYVSASTYPYTGHLDDPNTPTVDLNFDAPRKLFFSLNNSYPSKSQYKRFWRNTVNEIADLNAKMLKANFRLSALDIANRDLSNTIYINGTNFRINKIDSYQPDPSLTTAVELIRQPFQEHDFATIEVINNISGSTFNSELNVSISSSDPFVSQNPSTLRGLNSSGTTTVANGLIEVLPAIVGTQAFIGNIILPTGSTQAWSVTVKKNASIIGTFIGVGSGSFTVNISDIEEGDTIVFNGTVKQYSYMSINVDGNSIGTLSSITANGVSMEYISGSTLPFGAGSTALYRTDQIGTPDVAASFTSFAVSGNTAQIFDTDGSTASQNIAAGSSTNTFPALIMNANGTARLNVIGQVTYFLISEDSAAVNTTITGLSCGGDHVTYISGSTFPIANGQSGLYSSPNTGSQTVITGFSVSVSGDTWTSTDTIGTFRSTQLGSTGSPIVSTTMICNANGTTTVQVQGLVLGDVTVRDDTPTGRVFVTGIDGYTDDPILGGKTRTGTHDGFTGAINCQVIIAAGLATHLILKVNGTTVQSLAATSGFTGDRTFTSRTYASSDTIEIDWETDL